MDLGDGLSGTVVLGEKWPVFGRQRAGGDVAADLDRPGAGAQDDRRPCPRAGRVPAECEREGVDPVTANRAHVAVFVRELTSRPHHRGANVVGWTPEPGWPAPRSSSGYQLRGIRARKTLSAEGRPHLRGFPRNTDSVDCDEGAFHRMVPVRLFYDFLMEEGLRESNPVGRGRYTPGGRAERSAAWCRG